LLVELAEVADEIVVLDPDVVDADDHRRDLRAHDGQVRVDAVELGRRRRDLSLDLALQRGQLGHLGLLLCDLLLESLLTRLCRRQLVAASRRRRRGK
jgi:hypothetical protein